MTDTAETTNGRRGVDQPPAGTQTGGRKIPDKTKVDIDLAHRLMVEEYIGWYYPGVKAPPLDHVVNELIGIAWGLAKNDPKRPESPDERRERLTGKGQQ